MSRRAKIMNNRLQCDMHQIAYGFYMMDFYDVDVRLVKFMDFKLNSQGTTPSRHYFDNDQTTICIFDRPKKHIGRDFDMGMVDISGKSGWYIASAKLMAEPIPTPDKDVAEHIKRHAKRNVT